MNTSLSVAHTTFPGIIDRGTILNNTGDVVMRNFPYTLEINLPFTNEQRDFFQQRSFRYFKSHEGTIIRVFFYNNQ